MVTNFRILVGSSTLKAGGQIKSLLLQKGFNVDGICTSGNMLIRKCRTTKPHLVILNYELSDINGAEVAKIICGEKISKVILLCTSQQYNFVMNWGKDVGLFCMQKPIKAVDFIQLVTKVHDERNEDINNNKQNNRGRNIDDKKIIDKAKQIIMKTQGLLEDEAYRKLQKESMDNKLSMLQLSKKLILEYSQ